MLLRQARVMRCGVLKQEISSIGETMQKYEILQGFGEMYHFRWSKSSKSESATLLEGVVPLVDEFQESRQVKHDRVFC